MEKKEENLTIIISKYELSGNENKNWLKKMVLNKERMFKKKKKWESGAIVISKYELLEVRKII